MQNQTAESKTAARSGRSSIDRLSDALREAVDAAIADGATVDEITARIRMGGEDCSRSAVGRYAKNMRELIRRQKEADRVIKAWVQELGARPEGGTGLILIETLRTMTLATMAALSGREEPVTTQELARLSIILKRIEDTDGLRLKREQAAEKETEKEAAAAGTGRDKGRKTLSPETVAAMREALLGRPSRTVTSVPVDPWNPEDSFSSRSSHSSHFIPPDPGESHFVPPDPGESHFVPPDPGESHFVPPDPGESHFVPPDPGESRPENQPHLSHAG